MPLSFRSDCFLLVLDRKFLHCRSDESERFCDADLYDSVSILDTLTLRR